MVRLVRPKKNALNFGAPPLLNKGIILLYGHGSRFQDMLDSWNILELHEPHALDPIEATWPSGGSPCLACSTCIGLACAATSVGDKNTRTRRPEMAPKSIQTLGNQLKSWIWVWWLTPVLNEHSPSLKSIQIIDMFPESIVDGSLGTISFSIFWGSGSHLVADKDELPQLLVSEIGSQTIRLYHN